jgi:hypothetical protein
VPFNEDNLRNCINERAKLSAELSATETANIMGNM